MQCLTAIIPPEVHAVRGLSSAILDPKVLVLTIIDLDMVRGVERCDDGWITDSMLMYSGCPATERLLGETRVMTADHGYMPAHIILQLDPLQTTDWMSPDTRERLRQYGTSLSQAHACHVEVPTDVQCSYCADTYTPLTNGFGSMACKASYRCDSYHEPPDYFECV